MTRTFHRTQPTGQSLIFSRAGIILEVTLPSPPLAVGMFYCRQGDRENEETALSNVRLALKHLNEGAQDAGAHGRVVVERASLLLRAARPDETDHRTAVTVRGRASGAGHAGPHFNSSGRRDGARPSAG